MHNRIGTQKMSRVHHLFYCHVLWQRSFSLHDFPLYRCLDIFGHAGVGDRSVTLRYEEIVLLAFSVCPASWKSLSTILLYFIFLLVYCRAIKIAFLEHLPGPVLKKCDLIVPQNCNRKIKKSVKGSIVSPTFDGVWSLELETQTPVLNWRMSSLFESLRKAWKVCFF